MDDVVWQLKVMMVGGLQCFIMYVYVLGWTVMTDDDVLCWMLMADDR